MSRLTSHALFTGASTLPAVALLLACVWAGIWPIAAILSMTAVIFAMDRYGPDFESAFSGDKTLPWAVGLLHFVVLFAVVWAVGLSNHLDTGQSIALLFAAGLFVGQVSNACAHELIHRQDRASRYLGTLIFCSILNGHHVSAHMLVHHVHAGTSKDPNSAPLGQGLYRFINKATRAEFMAGWQAETKRRAGQNRLRHPYFAYLTISAACIIGSALSSGLGGTLAFLAICLHAHFQLLLSDYVQHYGLRRKTGANGKPEPMGPQHSWNAPHPYSAATMMNAPRHSDHHANPQLSFGQLTLNTDSMPVLPHSVPIMGAIALVPPAWRRIMDPKARKWAEAPKPLRAPIQPFNPSKSEAV